MQPQPPRARAGGMAVNASTGRGEPTLGHVEGHGRRGRPGSPLAATDASSAAGRRFVLGDHLPRRQPPRDARQTLTCVVGVKSGDNRSRRVLKGAFTTTKDHSVGYFRSLRSTFQEVSRACRTCGLRTRTESRLIDDLRPALPGGSRGCGYRAGAREDRARCAAPRSPCLRAPRSGDGSTARNCSRIAAREAIQAHRRA
jgi:hypothetical protein